MQYGPVVRAALQLVMYAAGGWWWLAPLAGLLLAFAGFLFPSSAWWAAVLAVVGTLGLALEARAKVVARSRSEEFKVLLNDCLQPLTRSLLVLALKTTSRARYQKLPDVLWPVLTAALSLTDVKRSRASFFVRTLSDGVDCLVPHPTLSTGRGDAPVSRFRRGVGEGREVWRAAEAGEAVYYADLAKQPPPEMDTGRQRSYNTFISVPLEIGGRVVGLLTINAQQAGDLRRDDVGVLQVLAALASVALAMCDGWPEDAAH